MTTRNRCVFRCVQYQIIWLTLCSSLGWACLPAIGQTGPDQSITGGPATSLVVPPLEQRRVPSELEYRNLVQRPDGDQQSISGLLQNVQAEDATIDVIVGRGRLITLQEPLADPEGTETPVVAVGDPTAVDFDILPNSRMIRILGRRVGITDLSVVTASGNAYSFTVNVVYDLNLLRAYIKQLFPNAHVNFVQMYEHIIVEGEASSTDQVNHILQAMNAFLTSSQVARTVESQSQASPGQPRQPDQPAFGLPDSGDQEGGNQDPFAVPAVEGGIDDKPDVTATLPPPQIINLIRVPGVQQVMLSVKVVELNRTAFRQQGASWLYRDTSGRTFGSTLGTSGPLFDDDTGNLLGLALGSANSAFAILPNTTLSVVLDTLRANQIIHVLAEPNLMAMHGQQASFLAGGEFPVPVPQTGTGGGGTVFTIEYKEFGVLLDFVPYIMDDGSIRLHVAPEVSTIDPSLQVDTGLGVIPGLATRRANTTVELRQGQTLALAGLLQLTLEADTTRLPGLGDLPYIGPFFSNSSHERVEKELIILVTPHYVDPMEPHQVGPMPGCEIRDPDDYEFYMLQRLESRAPHVNYRATNNWDDPLGIRRKKMQQSGQIVGPYGFSR
ncbi:MAG: type II and III secretion system protein family protein [Pirellulaceae bacterium]